MENYKELLMSKHGYTEYEAIETSSDLMAMDEESKGKLYEYFNGQNIKKYSCGDFTIGSLMKDYGFNVFSALLSISALKKDYDGFSRMLKKGIK